MPTSVLTHGVILSSHTIVIMMCAFQLTAVVRTTATRSISTCTISSSRSLLQPAVYSISRWGTAASVQRVTKVATVTGKRFLSAVSDEDYFKRVKAEADKVYLSNADAKRLLRLSPLLRPCCTTLGLQVIIASMYSRLPSPPCCIIWNKTWMSL